MTPAHRLADLLSRMEGSTRDERLALPGMRPKRVDTIVPGAVLLLEIMRLFGIERLEVSQTGLREGLFSEAAAAYAAGRDLCEWRSAMLDSAACDGHLPLLPLSDAASV
jgi:exopolyphosphatase/pppGpp-phosphohydrolase